MYLMPLMLPPMVAKRQAKAASASTVATLPQQLFLLPETDLETVLLELESLQPKVAIIDSIQALYYGALTSAPRLGLPGARMHLGPDAAGQTGRHIVVHCGSCHQRGGDRRAKSP